jgi:hypothetical protein
MTVFTFDLCKHDFFDSAIADIFRTVHGGAFGGAFIEAFCIMDYMGLAMNPSLTRNTGAEFKSFIATYLAPTNARYSSLQNELWAARNSLIHVYGQSSATQALNLSLRFTTEEPGNHLRLGPSSVGPNTLPLNLPDLVGELVAAVELFFRAQTNALPSLELWHSKLLLARSFSSAASRLSVFGSGLTYATIHPWLSVLDGSPSPTPLTIVGAVSSSMRTAIADNAFYEGPAVK